MDPDDFLRALAGIHINSPTAYLVALRSSEVTRALDEIVPKQLLLNLK